MNKKPNWLVEQKSLIEGQSITYSYDKEGDILEIIFQPGGGTGIDLTNNIVLRFNQNRGLALSLIVTSFSKLIRSTKSSNVSFPFASLNELPPEMHKTVLKILHSLPVNHFLRMNDLSLELTKDFQSITSLLEQEKLRPERMAA